MIEIATQKDLALVQSTGFCYLCGKKYVLGDETTKDHVPPKTIFSKEDRKNPLILPTCSKCNQDQSQYDEMTGQLMSFFHGAPPSPQRLRLSLRTGKVIHDGTRIAFTNLNLNEIVWRWIRIPCGTVQGILA